MIHFLFDNGSAMPHCGHMADLPWIPFDLDNCCFSMSKDGYVLVRPHSPAHGKRISISMHRMVMQNHLQRWLKRTEIVHHKNGLPWDNRLENLELCEDKRAHIKAHVNSEIGFRNGKRIAATRLQITALHVESALNALNRADEELTAKFGTDASLAIFEAQSSLEKAWQNLKPLTQPGDTKE